MGPDRVPSSEKYLPLDFNRLEGNHPPGARSLSPALFQPETDDDEPEGESSSEYVR